MDVFWEYAIIFSIFFGVILNKYQTCNNNVNVLLINKTQSYIESQIILFERTWDIDARNVYAATGDKDMELTYQERIPRKYKVYNDFLKIMRKYDIFVQNEQNKCSKLNNLLVIINILISILAILQIIIVLSILKSDKE